MLTLRHIICGVAILYGIGMAILGDLLYSIYNLPLIGIMVAVVAGLINQEFLDTEREKLGPLCPRYYECDFYNSFSTWYKSEYFQYGDYGEDM